MSALPRFVRTTLVVAVATACGGESGPDRTADTTADLPADTTNAEIAAGDTTASTLLPGGIPSGSPMPAAEDAGGVPPYPGAAVYHRSRRSEPDLRAFEAFSEEPVDDVVEFYDRQLPSWRRVDARDADVWILEPDRAAVTVSAWDRANAHPDLPRFLREEARTVIGVAWRVRGDASSAETPSE